MAILSFGLKAKGARLFGFLMTAVAIWCFSISGQMLSASETMSEVWGIVMMIGVVFTPPIWLLFAHDYTGRMHTLTWWKLVLIFINPVITYILFVTPSLRYLIVEEIIYQNLNGYLISADWVIGRYFLPYLAISFLTVLLGDIVILRHVVQWPKSSRFRMILMIVATLFPLFTNFSMVFNLFPNIHGNIDVFGFSVMGIVLGYVMYMEKMLELQPIAAQQLMEELPDGLLVFDTNHTLVEINPYGRDLLGDQIADDLKNKFEAFLLNEDLLNGAQVRDSLKLHYHGEERHFDVLVSPLKARTRIVGYQMLLRDVTELIHTMEQLELLATTDPLTGLHNRRFFHIEGERVYAEAIRYGHPVCVMTFDVDHFKWVNDRYGHPAGDQVLKEIAELVSSTSRTVDIVARFGGDEFFILLPQSTETYAVTLAKRIRLTLQHTAFNIEGHQLHLTSSFGVASCFPTNEPDSINLDELMRIADQQLYEAKSAGGNKIRSFPELSEEDASSC
jgi:diguanylate cyclase (GGDEF)-like protein